ncbi:MAG: hypothetical protein ACRDR6_06745 [Pseudonocardiaceae bacterium]
MRDIDDWWGSPLDTALAAVAATRHPAASRVIAERSVDRLLRWWREGQVRPVSTDAAALALTARAAASLARREPQLLADALAATDRMATRDASVVPDLHVALAAWALDDLQRERDACPWPAIRRRLYQGPAFGLDVALRDYLAGIAQQGTDTRTLVQRMLTSSTLSPAPADVAVVLWLLTISIARASRVLGADEPGLGALADWRTGLVERLAGEIDEDSFRLPEGDDFDPDAEPDKTTMVFLSPTEALLMDIALASPEPEQPWLRFPEAEVLFGEHAREQAIYTRRWMRRTAIAVAAGGLTTGTAMVLALSLVGVAMLPAIGFGVVVWAGVSACASGIWQRSGDVVPAAEPTTVLCATLALVALLFAVNGLLPRPLFSDVAGLAGAALVTAIAIVFATLLGRHDNS